MGQSDSREADNVQAVTNSPHMNLSVQMRKPAYFLGEVLESIAIGHITVEVVCNGKSICPTVGDSDLAFDIINKATLFKSNPVTVFDERSSGGATLVPQNPFSVNLSLPLHSADLPSSLNWGNNYIIYHLVVSVYGLSGEVLAVVKNELTVHSCLRYPQGALPMRVGLSHVTPTFLCCGVTNAFTFSATCDKTVYAPGDKVHINYWLETTQPDSLPWLPKLELLFFRKRTSIPFERRLQTHGSIIKDDYHKYTHMTVATPVVGHVHSTSVDIPAQVEPDYYQAAAPNVMHWHYCLVLDLFWSGKGVPDPKYYWMRSNVLSLPIVVNGMNAAQLGSSPLTLQAGRLSEEALAAQRLYASQPPPIMAGGSVAVAQPMAADVRQPRSVELTFTVDEHGAVTSEAAVATAQVTVEGVAYDAVPTEARQ